MSAFGGKCGFRGELAMKVTRARPTFWQRIIDFIRGLT